MTENFNLRTWAEVDLDAVENNFDLLSNLLCGDTLKMAVVKADAYGHGACRIAKCLENKADYFGVASVDEAIELREGGIADGKILILGHTSEKSFHALFKYNVTPTVWDFGEALKLQRYAEELRKTINIHIALNTGMNRIGFEPNEESLNQVKAISDFTNVNIEGIFSHFADSDNGIDTSFTLQQLELFRNFTSKLSEKGVHIPIRHIFNSAAVTQLDCEFELVREGIYLYGIAPSNTVNLSKVKGLKSAMSLRSEVIHIHEIEKGTPISYGCTFKAPERMKVATVCAGYADGVPRALSNIGYVIINGKKSKITGRICMDQLMCDITEIDDVEVGTVVTLFGTDCGATLTVSEIAREVGTIPYEIICGISKRVPRVYFKNGEFECIHYGIPHA